jgi:hypothetical protein
LFLSQLSPPYLFLVLDQKDVEVMDAFCARTRADLEADPNALEFFNTFSSKENVSKITEMRQLIQEGYEPGGHRITALRGSLTIAGEILAAAYSSSFFTHIGRTNIGSCALLSQLLTVRLTLVFCSACLLQILSSVGLRSQPSQDFVCVSCRLILSCSFCRSFQLSCAIIVPTLTVFLAALGQRLMLFLLP